MLFREVVDFYLSFVSFAPLQSAFKRFPRLPSIDGKLNWMRAFPETPTHIEKCDPVIPYLKRDFPEVLKEVLGTFKTKIKLYLIDTEPMFTKACPILLAMRIPIERELYHV